MQKLSIEVIEVSPPKVDTDLGGPGLHTDGIPIKEFVDAVMVGLEKGDKEITYGFSTKAAQASRLEREELFKMINR